MLFGCFFTVAVALGAILFYIIKGGAGGVKLRFILSWPGPTMAEGIFPALVGSFYLCLLALLFSVPTAIVCAIYLCEYLRESVFVSGLRVAINNLASTPSIVFGLFGLSFFVKKMGLGESLLASGLTLAVLTLPVLVRTCEEAIKAVPPSLREASLALGATKWQTTLFVVLPAATPGILTGMIISLARVAGETAPILFTGAVFYMPHLPLSPLDRFMALPYHLYVLATSGLDPQGTRAAQYATALVLLALVLSLNSGAIILRDLLRRRHIL
jgi:phosphate transport system permease protein